VGGSNCSRVCRQWCWQLLTSGGTSCWLAISGVGRTGPCIGDITIPSRANARYLGSDNGEMKVIQPGDNAHQYASLCLQLEDIEKAPQISCEGCFKID
jgi:hypothetical protein